jgi:SEC-C motif-containing protein
MSSPGFGDACPCGSSTVYAACCGPLHSGREPAETAERLMRSRYAAYAVGELDHLFRTWHPRTRPDDLTATPGLVWTGLTIIDVVDGGPDDETGEVEFRASYTGPGGTGTMHERSRFERRAGRWVYVAGDVSGGAR